jgi:membrane dipeptidase
MLAAGEGAAVGALVTLLTRGKGISMILIDSHLDLSLNALNWNRDLTRTTAEIRRSERDMQDFRRGKNTVALPEMRQGEVAVCLATVLTHVNPEGKGYIDFRNQEIAWAMAQGQLAYYRILEEEGQLRQLRSWSAMEAHLKQWNESQGKECPLGYILAMEGADPILSPAHVSWWWEQGLRVLGVCHFGSGIYSQGTGREGGLTSRGPELLKAMDKAGIVLDLTHLADHAFWEALDQYQGPVLASHNNCRALVPGCRQFSDEQLCAIIKRDGIIGVALDIWMLYPGFAEGVTPNTVVSLEDVANHIDHICQLAGDTQHAAIGSDLDGEFGTEQTPHDVNTIADLQKMPAILRRRGYSEKDIERIMHGNWLGLFQKALPP